MNNRNLARWFGGFAAIGLVAFTGILYFCGLSVYLSGYAYLGYVISIGLAAIAAMVQRRMNGGWLGFQEALRTSFTVLVLALAAQTLFTWFLLNVADTHFRDALAAESLKRTEEFLRAHGMPASDLEKVMTDQRSSHPFSFWPMMLGLAFSCVVHFIVALLIAAVVKKKKEE